jgi:hypothetical protein
LRHRTKRVAVRPAWPRAESVDVDPLDLSIGDIGNFVIGAVA